MISFTLIHYTEGWHLGATVTLAAVPAAGSLVKSTLDAPENYSDIYYVDNVLWSDGGVNYLFVRPFDGYGEMAPLTESDRLREAVEEVTQAVDNLTDNIMEQINKLF